MGKIPHYGSYLKPMELKPILQAILAKYSLPLGGFHGVAHWGRVLENGRRLSPKTGANLDVVSLFAILHDSRRQNEGYDPDHGYRGAEFAKKIRRDFIPLSDAEFELLYRACEGHTDELTHPDVTIQTCWDSDRLDLGRVGIVPHPSRLCTEAARQSETIDWAYGRSTFQLTPTLVQEEWGIDLSVGDQDE